MKTALALRDLNGSFAPIFKHRKHEKIDIPSWGNEGYLITPFCSDQILFPANSEDPNILFAEIPLPSTVAFDYAEVRLKSTRIFEGFRLLDFWQETTSANLLDILGNPTSELLVVRFRKPDNINKANIIGGIFSIALVDKGDGDPVTLKFEAKLQKESESLYSVVNLMQRLPNDKLWKFAVKDLETGEELCETAWIDPGFDGVIYVPPPKKKVSKALIVAEPFLTQTGTYDGFYRGDNRLVKL